MSCCTHANAAGRFFSFFAKRYRKRFQKKGFEPSQHQLVEGLKLAGIKNAKLLEIGCGVGYLHQCLLADGAAYALGIELSEKMLSEARQWAKEKNMEACTAYRLGDFLDIADTIEPADITILDKVVCCYPDADSLVHTSLTKTRNIIALTYPRNRWYVRLAMKLAGALLWAIRCPFRSYVHNPKQIEQWITAQGFRKTYQNKTFIWLTQVYIKSH